MKTQCVACVVKRKVKVVLMHAMKAHGEVDV